MKTVKLIALAVVLMFGLDACRRRDDQTPTAAEVTEELRQINSSTDESTVSGEVDDLTNAAEAFLAENNNRLMRTPAGDQDMTVANFGNWRCGGITADSVIGTRNQYTLIFNNNVCNGRTRNGRIHIRLTSGTRWTDAGAVLQIEFDNMTISRPVNGTTRNIVVNGAHTITNVSGGRVIEATATRTIVHKVRGRMAVNLDNGGSRNWNIYRRLTYTSGNAGLIVSLAGDTTIGQLSNLAILGTDRYDYSFNTRILQPVVSNAQCGFWKPVSGERLFTIDQRQILVKFGLNSAGTPVAAGTCATHYSIEPGATNTIQWTKRIIAY